MPLRIHPALACLLLGGGLIAGCQSARSGPGAKAARGSADPGNSALSADYSPGAVRARVEAHAHYTAAILHEQNDEPELAAEELYLAAMADPSNEPLVLDASRRLLRLPTEEETKEKANAAREKALALLVKASNVSGASGAIFARLGLVYSMLGKKEQAVAASRKAIERSPESLAGYQFLAQHYLHNHQLDEGIKVLNEAARQPRVDANYLVDLGETYMLFAREGRMETIKPQVLDVFRRAAALQPTNPVLQQRLADGFSFLGEVDRAVDLYLKLLERMPNLTLLRDKLVELYLRKQDRTNAAAQLRAVVRESPTNPKTHYLLGSLLFEEKNSKEAAEYFRKTILLSPGFEPAYHDLAAAQINNDEPKEALQTLSKARDKFPENFVCEFYTALAYSRMKDYTNALRYLTSAEVIGRVNATNRLTSAFYFQLGSAYERNHKFSEAETYFRKSLDLAPDFAEALNYLGYMWAERGENLEEARRMIEKALRLEPKNAAYLDSLGWVLYKLGKPKEALPCLQQALQESTEPDPTLFDHLGYIYAALQQQGKAREAWQKSLSLEPNQEVEKKLKAANQTAPAP
jgi:tetratricopeptide (TPR) repeat protein